MEAIHPKFRQKILAQQAMHERSVTARAEAHKRCRFYVARSGEGWGIFETETCRIHGQRERHADAVRYAEQIEDAIDKRDTKLVTAKDLGERMTRWASCFGLVLVAWAIWGWP